VPEDILVTGYDDVPEGGRPGYGLTTLAQPIGALTRGALRMACERLAGTAEPGERRLMPVRLVVRGSTGG
jgi:LacI family transcriptional regulator